MWVSGCGLVSFLVQFYYKHVFGSFSSAYFPRAVLPPPATLAVACTRTILGLLVNHRLLFPVPSPLSICPPPGPISHVLLFLFLIKLTAVPLVNKITSVSGAPRSSTWCAGRRARAPRGPLFQRLEASHLGPAGVSVFP